MTDISQRHFAEVASVVLVALAGIFASPCLADTKDAAASGAQQKQFEELCKAPWQEAFFDSCTQDWTQQWTLDGLKATVVNGPKGMDFSAGPVFAEDASDGVLWTKQSFKGDLKIEYEYTRIDHVTRSSSTMLYIEATGIGEGPYAKDIATWASLRTVPTMTLYHSGMHLLHISCAAFEANNDGPTDNYCRARWYGKGLEDSVLSPDYLHSGLFATGVPHQITVIKKGHDLFMRVQGPTKELLCHWDTSSKPAVTEGYIGLRHMFTRAVRYRDFRVSTWGAAAVEVEDLGKNTTSKGIADHP